MLIRVSKIEDRIGDGSCALEITDVDEYCLEHYIENLLNCRLPWMEEYSIQRGEVIIVYNSQEF